MQTIFSSNVVYVILTTKPTYMKKAITQVKPRKHCTLSTILLGMSMMMASTTANAQLSSNPDKFLGNITTSYQVDFGKEKYYTLWNQITCENESKWGSVEGSRNSYNWGCDNAFNYAKQHKFTYKFHALVWGAQYPGWFKSELPIKERYAAIVKWFDAVKKKYSTLPLIDVVNEAVGMHQQGNPLMKESLGGEGKTGYDWLIKAFELAYERWPDAILIYNDFNTFQWNTNEYIELVRMLRDAGAPIDAYGCQSHDLTDCDVNKFKNSMVTLQSALKMPMYITEYDIGTNDDNYQKQRYMEQLPYMWEADYCAGVTLWGYIYGRTWTGSEENGTKGNSGLIRDSQDRPAMTWLRDYMKSSPAKTAKSPFPGMKKEASIYVRPLDIKVAKGDVLPIQVRASMATKTIEKVELYVGSELIATMTEAPYQAEYTVPTNTTGWKTLKAVVTTTDGETFERLSRFNILSSTTKRSPYSDAIPELPGTINITEYDKGAQGVTYDKASRSTTANTQTGGWMEYTVDVKEDGIYSFDAEVASTVDGASFHLSEYSFDNLTFLADIVEVPQTGGSSIFKTMHGVLTKSLTAGRHRICLNIDKGGFKIKSLTFRRYEQDKSISVSVKSVSPATISVGDKTTITVNASSSTSTIAEVKAYANDLLIGIMTEAPYTFEFEPLAAGSYTITAIATTAEGKEKMSAKKTLKVSAKRSPYSNSPIIIPGIIEAENFDKGGEGFTFHDSDSQREGDVNYRSDSEGVDFVRGNGGVCIGYTAANEWLEFTVDVKEAGKYNYAATVSSGTTGSGFTIGLVKNGSVTSLAKVNVPKTADNDWNVYQKVEGKLSKDLEAGQQIIRITINGANCNIDKIELTCANPNGIDAATTEQHQPTGPVYNLSGQKVDANYHGIIIKNGRKILVR